MSDIIHTSESLKAQDSDMENYHYQLEDGEKYQLTSGEIGWIEHINGKYCIADHLYDHSYCDDEDNLIYIVDIEAMSEALRDDDCRYKAVMLSDDAALQAIFFYSNSNN